MYAEAKEGICTGAFTEFLKYSVLNSKGFLKLEGTEARGFMKRQTFCRMGRGFGCLREPRLG